MKFNLDLYCILFPKQAIAFNLGEQNIFKQFHYRCFYFIIVYLPLGLPSHKIFPDNTISQRIHHLISLPSPFAFYCLSSLLSFPLFFFTIFGSFSKVSTAFSSLHFPISSPFIVFPPFIMLLPKLKLNAQNGKFDSNVIYSVDIWNTNPRSSQVWC